MTPVPITVFQTAKSRRGYSGGFGRPVEARIIPDSYFSSMGSAFTEAAQPPTADRDGDRKLARLRRREQRECCFRRERPPPASALPGFSFPRSSGIQNWR